MGGENRPGMGGSRGGGWSKLKKKFEGVRSGVSGWGGGGVWVDVNEKVKFL